MPSKQGDWKMVKSLFRRMEKKRQKVAEPGAKPRGKADTCVPSGHVRYRYQVYAHDYAVPAAMFLLKNEAFDYAKSVKGLASVVDVDMGRMWHVDVRIEEADAD